MNKRDIHANEGQNNSISVCILLSFTQHLPNCHDLPWIPVRNKVIGDGHDDWLNDL